MVGLLEGALSSSTGTLYHNYRKGHRAPQGMEGTALACRDFARARGATVKKPAKSDRAPGPWVDASLPILDIVAARWAYRRLLVL